MVIHESNNKHNPTHARNAKNQELNTIHIPIPCCAALPYYLVVKVGALWRDDDDAAVLEV